MMPKNIGFIDYILMNFSLSGFKFKPDKNIEKSIYNSISSNPNTGGVYKPID